VVHKREIVKALVIAATLVPVAWLTMGASRIASGGLYTRNVINSTGDWAFRFLILTLCITPLRRLTRWHSLIRLRRILGLTAFFYSVIHVVLWAMLDWSLHLRAMTVRITADPFFAVGTAAFVLLIPLAITSNRASISRLGRQWRQLHRLTYPALVASIAHYWLSGPLVAPIAARWIVLVMALLTVRLIVALHPSAFAAQPPNAR
jgi:sulfoxide reductase heme-binding subunit YedZ